MEERSDRFTALEDRYAGYEVYDPAGEKIGKVDDLFVDEGDQPEYIQHVAMRLNRVAQWMHVNALGHPRRQTISTVMRADR